MSNKKIRNKFKKLKRENVPKKKNTVWYYGESRIHAHHHITTQKKNSKW